MLTLKHTPTPKHITITDQETYHLTQHQRLTLVHTHLTLKDFDFTQPIQYNYNPHTQTTTITQ